MERYHQMTIEKNVNKNNNQLLFFKWTKRLKKIEIIEKQLASKSYKNIETQKNRAQQTLVTVLKIMMIDFKFIHTLKFKLIILENEFNCI